VALALLAAELPLGLLTLRRHRLAAPSRSIPGAVWEA